MPEPITVLLLIPHLGGGGAERVMELLARHLPLRGMRVHLGVVTRQQMGGAEGMAEELPELLTVHRLNCRRIRHAALPILRLIHKTKPQVILTGIVHLNHLLLMLRPLIAREHALLIRQTSAPSTLVAAYRHPRLVRLLYGRAHGIICQSDAMARELTTLLHPRPGHVHVLRNPIDLAAIERERAGGRDEAQLPWRNRGARLISLGRLSEEKGYDLLIEAVAHLRRQMPEVELLLLGEGIERAALERQAARLGIEDAIHFAGYNRRPWRYFASASLYVQPSRHEGMPNALLEAAAAGLPIVSTPSTAGITDVAGNQEGIWICREVSVQSLTETLTEALHSLKAGNRFAHAWLDEFGLERAVEGYAQLFEETAARVRS